MSNLEYITQARKLLTEDYKTKHANEYNSWLAKHQNSWMQPHVIVPFPPFIVSSALAPFKASVSEPSEEAVVAKALEIYNQFNPTPAKVKELVVEPAVATPVIATPVTAEPVVEETIIEPVVEETIVEAIVEPVVETIIEPVAEVVVDEPLKTNDAIYKIFQQSVVEETVSIPTAEPMPPTIETALNIVPQPAEELAKVKNSGRILPSVLERLQAMKDKWSTTEEKNV